MPNEDPKPTVSAITTLFEAIARLIPILDKSTSGWWKIVLVAIGLGLTWSVVSFTQKIEPKHLQKFVPQHDSQCRQIDPNNPLSSINCE